MQRFGLAIFSLPLFCSVIFPACSNQTIFSKVKIRCGLLLILERLAFLV